MSVCGAFKGRAGLSPAAALFSHETPPVTYDNLTDTFADSHGCEFRQIFQDVPTLSAFYSDWEARFNAWPYVNWAERHFMYAWILCAAYLVFIYVGRKVMEGRDKYGLRGALSVWNAGLSLFSIVGFLRTAPHLLYYLYQRGFYASICLPGEPMYGHGACGFWVMLFIFSKVPELGDTVFIVLKKQPLIFLHWYHHVTVLLYCWHSYATRSSAGLYFVAMNYGVHALMYFYYFLASRGIKVKWGGLVTSLQISQMFVGMFICGAVYYFENFQNRACDIMPENYVAGLAMYASYAVLFIIFALEKYIFGTSSLDTKKVKEKVEEPQGKTVEIAENPSNGTSESKESNGVDSNSKGLRQRRKL